MFFERIHSGLRFVKEVSECNQYSSDLQHLAHHTERSTGERNKIRIETPLIAFETFAKPEPIDVRKKVGVLIHRTNE